MNRSSCIILASAIVFACGPSGPTKGDLSKGVDPPSEVTDPAAATSTTGDILLPGEVSGGTLTEDDPVLPDGSHFDVWVYQGVEGEHVTVEMRSDEIDSYLLLYGGSPEDPVFLAEDDDSGGGLDARIEITLPATGEYAFLANTFEAGETGGYAIRLDAVTGNLDQVSGGDWDTMYPGGGDPDERYALLVGVDDYPGVDNDLDGPVSDAMIMREVLIEEYDFDPDNVVVLLDEDGNRDHILNAFLRHLGQAGPDGLAVFYYSGHGVQLESNYGLTAPLDPEEDGMDEALAVWGEGFDSVILDDELGFTADRLEAGRTLILIDACFSGTGTRAPGGQPKRVEQSDLESLRLPARYLVDASASSGAKRVEIGGEPTRHILLAASADDEVAYTAFGWPELGGTASVFTYYLALALLDASDDLTFDELGAQIRGLTLDYTMERYGEAQTVQVEGLRSTESVREFLEER
jgi:uncharacterized caspase-like protein